MQYMNHMQCVAYRWSTLVDFHHSMCTHLDNNFYNVLQIRKISYVSFEGEFQQEVRYIYTYLHIPRMDFFYSIDNLETNISDKIFIEEQSFEAIIFTVKLLIFAI